VTIPFNVQQASTPWGAEAVYLVYGPIGGPGTVVNVGAGLSVAEGGAANLATGQVSVDTTAGGKQIAAARSTRRTITVVNHGTTDVYVGSSGVSTSTGVLLLGTKGAAVTLCTTAAVYGIVGSGTQTISYFEEYDS
jgi:hypothetical protein